MASRYSQTDVRRAIKGFDFEDFLTGQGCDVASNDTGEIRGTCPLCGSSKRKPFCVQTDTGVWICHSCNKRGGPMQLVLEVLDTDYPTALKRIVENFSVFQPEESDPFDEDEEEWEDAKDNSVVIELPEKYKLLADNPDSILAQPVIRYAKSRGIGWDLIRRYRMGYVASGRFASRLIVPVYHLGQLVTFVARDITDTAELKVDTPPGNDQGAYCFNLDNIWGREEVIVTEGVFDALMLPEMAIATFGKKISVEQVRLLMRSGAKTLTFCYDEDAIADAYKFADKWSMTFRVKLIELPPNRDPNKLGRDAMLGMLEDAIDVDPTLTVV